MPNDVFEHAASAVQIVTDAGGRLVGRTRLQKVAYLLEVMGFGDGFSFAYKHYGPYSEQLTAATQMANALNWVKEEEHQATWGGKYSIFVALYVQDREISNERKAIADFANRADAVELELAATAVLLSNEGYSDPWKETACRKPSKAMGGTLDRAKELLLQLKSFDAHGRLEKL